MSMDMGEFGLPSFVAFLPSFAKVLMQDEVKNVKRKLVWIKMPQPHKIKISLRTEIKRRITKSEDANKTKVFAEKERIITMEFMTAKEAAEKWNISVRLIQRYCAQGRIKGARKSGIAWEIPSGAVRPEDPRRNGKKQTVTRNPSFQNLMPLMNTPFQPGSCRELLANMKDGARKDIAFAEYYYFSGQPEKAKQKAEEYLICKNMELRLSACMICAFANLSVGQIDKAKQVLEEIRNSLKEDQKRNPQAKVIGAFIAAGASVLLHLPLPEEMPSAQEFLSRLPLGHRAWALYVEAHFSYLQKNYERSVGIIECALAMGAEQYPIPAIYLHLAAVMDYMSLKQPQMAERHLLDAWELARPDDLIEGFGEHHGLLGGMLESVIKQKWPEDFKRIINITYEFSAGWRKVHNPETGHEVADDLSTTEFAAAMLAARGWTNAEIGEHMNISANTVKHHISQAMKKLDIDNRKDLKQYMLQ